MSTPQTVIQVTITVSGDGAACVQVDPPVSGGGNGGGTPPPPCPPPGGTPPAPPPAAATCAAQRVVHLVGGNGGLSWFTLIWPAPIVITGFNPAFAYDNPATAGLVAATSPDHPLYARKIGARVVWEGIGRHPQPSVFVEGTNQTHTNTPQTTGTEVLAAGATMQMQLAAPLPVLAFKAGLSYGPAPGAPAPVFVAGIDAAIAALRVVTPIPPALEQDLRPDATKLASWGIDGSTAQVVVDLARNLLFAANVFRNGLVATVLLPAFNDDPHGAFAGGDAVPAARADLLARVLDGFYAELALHNEPKASSTGAPLSLADNVMLLVSGDTPKNSFNRNGWGDGTPGGTNLFYARSNGFLKPGWFGSITPNGKTNFDPTTGAASASALPVASTSATLLGVLFAMTRGNVAAVTAASNAAFAGVIEATPP
jgi:hypothetical protein